MAAMGVEWDHGPMGPGGMVGRAEQAEGAVRAMGGRAERAEQAEGAGMDCGPLKSAEKHVHGRWAGAIYEGCPWAREVEWDHGPMGPGGMVGAMGVEG